MKKGKGQFKAYENPTTTIIYIFNEPCDVIISYSFIDKIVFTLRFHYKDKPYFKTFPPLESKEKLFFADELCFDDIDLPLTERVRLANRINEIIDYIFN